MNRPKTLLFCTCYSLDQNTWKKRYQRWIDHYQQSTLEFDQILLIDDASPSFPQLNQIELINQLPIIPPISPVVLYHFQKHLGRKDIRDFPGWFRSFIFAYHYAKEYGFEKIVHLESDFLVLSGPLYEWINTLSSGWSTLFSKHYNFPECAIQIICQDQYAAFEHLSQKDYAKEYVGWDMETVLPFTQVNKEFIGDRSDALSPERLWAGDYLAQAKEAMILPTQSDLQAQSAQVQKTSAKKVEVTAPEKQPPSNSEINAQLNTISMTKTDVMGAYRILFERDPLTEDPIKELTGSTPDQLLAYLLLRPEFRQRPGIPQLILRTAQTIQASLSKDQEPKEPAKN